MSYADAIVLKKDTEIMTANDMNTLANYLVEQFTAHAFKCGCDEPSCEAVRNNSVHIGRKAMLDEIAAHLRRVLVPDTRESESLKRFIVKGLSGE